MAYVCADLHLHTVYSPDSIVQPKTLIDMLVAHSFVKAAAITDHDSVRGCRMAVELASVYKDILIIPGVEISTDMGDMLILGTDELPPKPWNPEVIVDYAKSIGAVSIVAHPFRIYGMGERAKDYKVDALEVLNGGSSKEANSQAKEFAKLLGLPGTAGTDAHQVSDLFSVYSQIQADLNVDSVLAAIKKGMVSAHIGKNSIYF